MNLDSFALQLLAYVFPWYQARLVEQVGGEVARECRRTLWQQISRRIRGMSVAEVRGYARAQAVAIVAPEVDEALVRRRLNPALRNAVLEASIDQLVALAVRDVLSEAPAPATRSMAA